MNEDMRDRDGERKSTPKVDRNIHMGYPDWAYEVISKQRFDRDSVPQKFIMLALSNVVKNGRDSPKTGYTINPQRLREQEWDIKRELESTKYKHVGKLVAANHQVSFSTRVTKGKEGRTRPVGWLYAVDGKAVKNMSYREWESLDIDKLFYQSRPGEKTPQRNDCALAQPNESSVCTATGRSSRRRTCPAARRRAEDRQLKWSRNVSVASQINGSHGEYTMADDVQPMIKGAKAFQEKMERSLPKVADTHVKRKKFTGAISVNTEINNKIEGSASGLNAALKQTKDLNKSDDVPQTPVGAPGFTEGGSNGGAVETELARKLKNAKRRMREKLKSEAKAAQKTAEPKVQTPAPKGGNKGNVDQDNTKNLGDGKPAANEKSVSVDRSNNKNPEKKVSTEKKKLSVQPDSKQVAVTFKVEPLFTSEELANLLPSAPPLPAELVDVPDAPHQCGSVSDDDDAFEISNCETWRRKGCTDENKRDRTPVVLDHTVVEPESTWFCGYNVYEAYIATSSCITAVFDYVDKTLSRTGPVPQLDPDRPDIDVVPIAYVNTRWVLDWKTILVDYFWIVGVALTSHYVCVGLCYVALPYCSWTCVSTIVTTCAFFFNPFVGIGLSVLLGSLWFMVKYWKRWWSWKPPTHKILHLGLEGKTYADEISYMFTPGDSRYALCSMGFNAYTYRHISTELLDALLREFAAHTLTSSSLTIMHNFAQKHTSTRNMSEAMHFNLLVDTVNAAYQQVCITRIRQRQATGNVGRTFSWLTPDDL